MTFQRHQTTGSITAYDVEKTNDAVERAFRPYDSRQHIVTDLLEDVALVIGVENWVEHKLGKTIRTWRVVDTTNAAMVWRIATSTADLTKYLPLGTTANTTIKLEVAA